MFALIRAATRIVPRGQQGQFEYEWQQKLFHRWQFLFHAQMWDAREEFKLFATAARSVPDAIQHFGSQEWVQTRVSRFIQSPLTCLIALLALFITICFVSGGLPATRDLLFKRMDRGAGKLVYVWTHNLRGGDRPLPADVVAAWRTHSQLITGAAAFRAVHREVRINGGAPGGAACHHDGT